MMVDTAVPSIAFVGAGPTTIYTLCAFVEKTHAGANVTIFEAQPRAGLGTPYRPGWNDPAMLSNIASIEIPPIGETLIDWLLRQPRARLVRLGIDPEAIDDRTFYPRLALGEYFLDQFDDLIARARERGIAVEIETNCRVADIAAELGGVRLSLEPNRGEPSERCFDKVVIATGHCWPEEPEARPGYFLSPWPATALQRIPAATVGIRGSSLTAIDAAVAIAVAHGSFIETDGEAVEYRASAGDDELRIVMMSRKGLLPEADFYHPVPYEPLAICTAEAMERLIAEACDTVLFDAYDLFRRELAHADPVYAEHVGLDELELEDFADRYFADRAGTDPFEWAVTNLAEARANYDSHITVPWRYAILRMHEVLALIVPHLNDDALHRFNRFLKPVFVDEYATVPHLSIERMLALHRSGRLEVMAIGANHRIDVRSAESGANVIVDGTRHHFPFLVDATGQRPLAIDAFPFPTLIEQSVVVDAAGGAKGVAVDELFHPASNHSAARDVFCLSIPFILSRHPFVQGITSSHEMGEVVGAALAEAETRAEVAKGSRQSGGGLLRLFAVYIGGEHPGAHVEVHDIRFVVAESISDTHDRLTAEWWGTPGTLHIDCWAEIDHADGYDVSLSPEPSEAAERLYFVNLGGYDGREFAEQHRNMFVVATTVAEAKARALKSATGWKDAHRDDFYEAEQAFALDEMVGDRLHIQLTANPGARHPSFTCRYTPLK